MSVFVADDYNIKDSVVMYANVNNPDKLPHIGDWDTSNVSDMSMLFSDTHEFNEDISKWNVSNVKNMRNMFTGVRDFNQPLNNWNVSNVQNMEGMFSGATIFNQPLNNWNVSNVQNMEGMFSGATMFNQPLNTWNVSKVENMAYMFSEAKKINQSLNNWNVSNVNSMNSMFEEAVVFNQPIDRWDVSDVADMSFMFRRAINFNQPLNNWNVSNVENMNNMFTEAADFNQNLSMWNLQEETDIDHMFDYTFPLEFMPPLVEENVRQNVQIRRVNIDAHQIHRGFASIDLNQLLNVLEANRNVNQIPKPNEFSTFIHNSLKQIVDYSTTDVNDKQQLLNGVNQIVNQRLLGINYQDLSPIMRETIYYAFKYIHMLPVEAQKEYINAYLIIMK